MGIKKHINKTLHHKTTVNSIKIFVLYGLIFYLHCSDKVLIPQK